MVRSNGLGNSWTGEKGLQQLEVGQQFRTVESTSVVGRALLPVAVLTGKSARPTNATVDSWPLLSTKSQFHPQPAGRIAGHEEVAA